ncbi:MAG: cytidylate kinase [Rickettsiales bacterium]|nr:cytidylate kinase [Rickettsiales bacterium]
MSSFKNDKPVIAIDGTAGSGKGTLAKNLCKFLKFDHLDSGILYRFLAYKFLKNSDKKIKLSSSFLTLDEIKKISLDVKQKLRSDKVALMASKIARRKDIRNFLVSLQRDFANRPPGGIGSVIDGRDIASRIIPNAEVKIYVDAEVEVRAKRRLKQMNLSKENFSQILESIKDRDLKDKSRKESPLIKTEGSIFLDTTKIDEKQAFEIVLRLIKKKIDYI